LDEFVNDDYLTVENVSAKYFSDLKNGNFKTFVNNFTDQEYFDFLKI